MADRFDKFTERAQRVLSMAQQEAGRFGHNYFGTEHLLLGLVAEKSGIAGRALSASDIQLPKVRSAIEQIIGRGQHESSGEIGLTPPMKQAIELAVAEARRLDHQSIDTEHLLLGVLRVEGCMAIGVLLSLGAEIEAVRTVVMALLSSGGDEGRASDPADASPIPSPELREAMVKLARLRQQEHELRARISEMQRSERRRGTPPSLSQQPTEPIDFDHFTERAKRVLTLSQEEAQRFNHNYIGTEHILLGLVREGDGIAARVLANLGIYLPDVRSAVEFIMGRGPMSIMGEIGLTPRAKTVLALAVDEAWRLNHSYIGTEHLLLGLVREGEGIAAGVLESKGVGLERLRAQVIQVLSGGQSGERVTTPWMATGQPQPPARTREEIAALQTPRGRLLQVIPIVQEQTIGDLTLVFIAIERYEQALIVSWQATVANAGHPVAPAAECLAEDDRGNRYHGRAAVNGVGGSSGGSFEGRFAYNFHPGLDPAARTLTLQVTLPFVPAPGGGISGSTRLEIAIPPLPTG